MKQLSGNDERLLKRDEVLQEQIFLRERARRANERGQLLNVPIN